MNIYRDYVAQRGSWTGVKLDTLEKAENYIRYQYERGLITEEEMTNELAMVKFEWEFEGKANPGHQPGLPKETEGEDTVGARLIKTLATKTLNDITYETMSRIVRRLGRMSKTDRGIPKRVADVLADEIGPQKALQYLDKALAAGHIKAKEYDEMRSALLLPMPRAEIPAPTVRRMAKELAEGQQRLKEDFNKLTGQGQAAFRKPFEAVEKDVKKMRKALGL